MASMRMRLVGLFAIVALPIVLEAASPWARAVESKIPRAAAALALSLLALLCLSTVSGNLYSFERHPVRFGYAESAAVFPVGNVETLRASGLHGRIFNAIEAGGYLAMHLPEEKTFADGRLEVMTDDFYVDYLRAICGAGWDRIEERYRPTLALVPANLRDLVRRLQADPGWILVGVDAVSFLFARDTPDQHAAIAEDLERLYRLDRPARAFEEKIFPPRRPPAVERLLRPRRFPFEEFGRGSNYLQAGLFEAARRELRQALLAADEPDAALVKAYAIATAQLGRIEESRAWSRRLLEMAPDDADARAILDQDVGG
jgi:tetratricopeptide (TPR) repeat protein